MFDLAEQNLRDDSPIYIVAPPDTTDDGETASIEQYHVHLPKLDSYDLIDWEPGSNTVEAGDRFEEIAPTLELLRDNREELPADSV
uniref:Uncharacterized protein n=1 Tax=Natrinema zhouii TaxID=1710539 RepID=A0A7D6CTU0_9EURY